MTNATRGITLLALSVILASGGVFAVSAHAEDATLSRAEAVALLVESSPAARDAVDHYRSGMPPVALFSDVRQHHWYAPFLESAFQAKLIQGNPDGTFRPGSVLSSEEAAILLSRAWQQESPLLYVPGPNPDVQYVPTLQEVAAAYGMRTPVSSVPLPREEYVYLLSLLYGNDAVASLDSSVMQWSGRQIAVGNGALMASVGGQHAPGEPYVFDDAVPADEPATAPEEEMEDVDTAPEQEAASPADDPELVLEHQEPQEAATIEEPLDVEHVDLPPPAPAPRIERFTPSTTTFVADASPAANDTFAISLPSLGIDSLNINHPADPFTHQGLLAPLRDGVGHLFSYPGRGGKILVYGHSSSYPWDVSAFTKIFRRISELQIGDRVTVSFEGRTFTYLVREKKTVPAKDLATYQEEGDGEELILYTCWPPDSISERYLVIATPEHEVADAW